MNRFLACFSALLLASCAAAQTPAAPAPAAPAAVTTTETSQVEQFQKIEDSWANAVNRHDQYGLELVLSPLFVDVAATGDVTTRNQQVANTIASDDKTLYLTQKIVTVRMLGDIAVANGTYTLHHKVGAGQVDEKGVFTHVFERVRGGWVCINSQRTLLREEPAARQKKQSAPSEPFHIPLFGKSDKSDQ